MTREQKKIARDNEYSNKGKSLPTSLKQCDHNDSFATLFQYEVRMISSNSRR